MFAGGDICLAGGGSRPRAPATPKGGIQIPLFPRVSCLARAKTAVVREANAMTLRVPLAAPIVDDEALHVRLVPEGWGDAAGG